MLLLEDFFFSFPLCTFYHYLLTHAQYQLPSWQWTSDVACTASCRGLLATGSLWIQGTYVPLVSPSMHYWCWCHMSTLIHEGGLGVEWGVRIWQVPLLLKPTSSKPIHPPLCPLLFPALQQGRPVGLQHKTKYKLYYYIFQHNSLHLKAVTEAPDLDWGCKGKRYCTNWINCHILIYFLLLFHLQCLLAKTVMPTWTSHQFLNRSCKPLLN